MADNKAVVSAKQIEGMILIFRGNRVMLSADLAELYGVEVRTLNQAVKRHRERFPDDFMFQLTWNEVKALKTQSAAPAAVSDSASRSQSVILKRGKNIKYRPYAFTEHGAIMAANVLNSKRAVEMSVYVVRAFVRLRALMASHEDLARKLDALERKYDSQFKVVFDAIRQLMTPTSPKRKNIGFVREEEGK